MRPTSPEKSDHASASSVSRRNVLVIVTGAVGTAASILGTRWPAAADEVESHGMSAFGDLKYPADFKHFDYVNPDAPKGGSFSQIGPSRLYNQNFLTFNSLNSFILKGDAAMGMELTFATLMAPTTAVTTVHDEPDAMYGSAARAVRISADGLDLHLPDAAAGALPRWQPAHRPRRCLLTEYPQGQRPSPHHPAVA